jgi:hypothetical protein
MLTYSSNGVSAMLPLHAILIFCKHHSSVIPSLLIRRTPVTFLRCYAAVQEAHEEDAPPAAMMRWLRHTCPCCGQAAAAAEGHQNSRDSSAVSGARMLRHYVLYWHQLAV